VVAKPFAAPVLQASPVVARLLTAREVAGRLALSSSTVHNLCARGRLHFVRIGATLRIDPASVEAFIASGGDDPAQG
jgi:excisionase family DNA binding protein